MKPMQRQITRCDQIAVLLVPIYALSVLSLCCDFSECALPKAMADRTNPYGRPADVSPWQKVSASSAIINAPIVNAKELRFTNLLFPVTSYDQT